MLQLENNQGYTIYIIDHIEIPKVNTILHRDEILNVTYEEYTTRFNPDVTYYVLTVTLRNDRKLDISFNSREEMVQEYRRIRSFLLLIDYMEE